MKTSEFVLATVAIVFVILALSACGGETREERAARESCNRQVARAQCTAICGESGIKIMNYRWQDDSLARCFCQDGSDWAPYTGSYIAGYNEPQCRERPTIITGEIHAPVDSRTEQAP